MVCLCRRSDTPTLRRVTPARPFLSKCCETRFPSPILSGYPHDTGMTLIRNELIHLHIFICLLHDTETTFRSRTSHFGIGSFRLSKGSFRIENHNCVWGQWRMSI